MRRSTVNTLRLTQQDWETTQTYHLHDILSGQAINIDNERNSNHDLADVSLDYIDKDLEKEDILKDIVIRKHHIIKYHLNNDIEQQQANSSREISFKHK